MDNYDLIAASIVLFGGGLLVFWVCFLFDINPLKGVSGPKWRIKTEKYESGRVRYCIQKRYVFWHSIDYSGEPIHNESRIWWAGTLEKAEKQIKELQKEERNKTIQKVEYHYVAENETTQNEENDRLKQIIKKLEAEIEATRKEEE